MRFCVMALLRVCVTCSWPTTSANRCGRYLRAMTWYDMPFEIQGCQGDHGGRGANCRCCIPALAGFVSPHSMGPGKTGHQDTARLLGQQVLFEKSWRRLLRKR